MTQAGRGSDSVDDALILFGFQRAGGVNETAFWSKPTSSASQDIALAGRLTRQVFQPKMMADFGIAREGASAAARNVAEDEVEA
jgi:hypothetical protein